MFNISRSRLLRQLLSACLGLICVFMFAACGAGPAGDAGSPTATETAAPATGETLKVALDPTFPPFQSQTGQGQFEGFDIDLINAIAEAAGFQMEMQGLPFDGIIPALQAGTMDATISTMTITAERAQVVDFSRPYFKAGLAIAVQEATTDIASYDDLQGKRIAVQIGTTGAEKAGEAQAATVRTFDNTPLALQELSNGNVDAAISDAPVILYAIQNGSVPGVKVVGELLTEEYYGIATPKDSPNLEKINNGLATILQNGKYNEIYQKWFGDQPAELPEIAPVLQ